MPPTGAQPELQASSLLVAGGVMRLRVIMLGIENGLRRVGIAARDLSVTTDFLKASAL
jgi:hypothetical protein